MDQPPLSRGTLPRPRARIPLRARLLLIVLVVPLVLVTVAGLVFLWPADANPPAPDFMGPPAHLADASVIRVDRRPCAGTRQEQGVSCQAASVRLTSGAEAGRRVDLEVSEGTDSPVLHRGDRIVVGRVGGPDAGSVDSGQWYFADYQRKGPLLALGLLFALAVVALARWRGILALVGLGVSFLVLVRFVLPAILLGANPVAVAVIGSAAIMFVALYLAHGINARTTTAVLGTVGSLLLTGALAWVFVEGAHLTGLADEESGVLAASLAGVSLRGLLLGGVVIGSLGVLDDVTVTQASVVWELHLANPGYDFRRLYSAGLRIGRDHVASTVNTLVLAYAGASLPLLVLFTLANRNLSDVLTGEIVAQEIIRTLVGSIGLVAAVPITTALAALVAGRVAEPYGVGGPSVPPHSSARAARRAAKVRRSSMPPPERPRARPTTKVPRGAAGRATP